MNLKLKLVLYFFLFFGLSAVFLKTPYVSFAVDNATKDCTNSVFYGVYKGYGDNSLHLDVSEKDYPNPYYECKVYIEFGQSYASLGNCSDNKNKDIKSLNGNPITNDGVYRMVIKDGDVLTCQKLTTITPVIPTAPPCNSDAVTMVVSPSSPKIGDNMTFTVSGSQGSTFVQDDWTNDGGSVDCKDGFWGTKTCRATRAGNVTWTHKWKNTTPNDLSGNNTSAQCSKQISFQVSASSGTETPSPNASTTPSSSGTNTPTPTGQSDVDLYFEPVSAVVGKSEIIDVKLMIDAKALKVNSADIGLQFYKTGKIELLGFNLNPDLNFIKQETPSIITYPENGLFRINAVKDLGSTATSPTGRFVFGTARFKVDRQAQGEVKISFTEKNITVEGRTNYVSVGRAQDAVFRVDPNKEVVESYQIAESVANLDTSPKLPYSPKISYTFSNSNQGVKRIYVRFFSVTGKQEVKFADITYALPPNISSIGCGYDPTGKAGTIVTINGKNFGENKGGKIKINGKDARIVSWNGQVQAAETSTVTLIPFPTNTPTPATASASATPTTVASPTLASASATPSIASPTATTAPTPTNAPLIAPAPSGGGGTIDLDSVIIARIDDDLKGEVPVEVLFPRSTTAITGSCNVGQTGLDLTVKLECRPSSDYSVSGVQVEIFDKEAYDALSDSDKRDVNKRSGIVITRQPINIDRKGKPTSFTMPKLQASSDQAKKVYVLLVSGPKTVVRKFEVQSAAGVTTVVNVTLPVGDIAPVGDVDGVINSLDFAQMLRDWNLTSQTAREGDLNLDSRVNSLDYACMNKNAGKKDEY